MAHAHLISVVDGDYSARQSLGSLLRSVGYAVKLFASAEEFRAWDDIFGNDCLILDIRTLGVPGIDLYRHLAAAECGVPVIFISAHKWDAAALISAPRPPVVAHLMKPIAEDTLLSAVAAAVSLRS